MVVISSPGRLPVSAIVHAGLAPEVQAARPITLSHAYAAHPERFAR